MPRVIGARNKCTEGLQNSTMVVHWSVEEVGLWLEDLGLQEYRESFTWHKITGTVLLMLTEADLKQELGIKVLGDVKTLWVAIQSLQANETELLGSCNATPKCPCQPEDKTVKPRSLQKMNTLHPTSCLNRNRTYSSDSQADSVEGVSHSQSTPLGNYQTYSSGVATNLRPEYVKTGISCLYVLLVTWVTAIVMVFVHDRVPDRARHPPLPDIFLDNVPHISWAFQLCEITIVLLSVTWIVILYFHKHRSILIRRFAALSGSVFLLRCATMFITSLSVPGQHLQCAPRDQSEFWVKIHQAWIIWKGGGLSIKGVRTCGDYMFSGHTTALTILNFFITEYTPRRMYFLHIASWVLNTFGIFFILAAHEHYSIDVFIAFYITSRMFLYYHSLANNRALHQRDSFRTKIWFPMFSYFEADIDGIVPNEYANPLCAANFNHVYNSMANFWSQMAVINTPVVISPQKRKKI